MIIHTSSEPCDCFNGERPFPSACGTYKRAQELLSEFSARSYKALKKGQRYNPPQVQRDLISAMDRGDEEKMKAFMLEIRDSLGGLHSSDRWEC